MEIICDKCDSRFRVPDKKIPTNKIVTLPCPKCRNKISVGPVKKKDPAIEAGFVTDAYDASEKPFDFVEEEGKTALICETNAAALKTIVNALNLMEYHITVSESGRDALKKMRYHLYDLIIVNEMFNCDGPDSNMVLLYLERLNMSVRRNIFVAMISRGFRTMDQMMAFRYSVNIIINEKNIDDFGKIARRGLTEYELFYRVYNDSLKSTGRL
ncbi:MAG: zinc-ribbon domain-containing protein [Desulfobacterales bacterium]